MLQYCKNASLLVPQNHYRDYHGRNKCVLENDFVTEKRLWHFKDKLIPRVAKAYYELGLYKDTTVRKK